MTKLFGREKEQRRLLDLLGRVRTGGGVGVVLVGDPGIGKSSMLDWLSSHAAGFTVLRARGHDADAGTSYLVLRQVLRSVRHQLGAIDQPLAEALAAAISLSGETTTEALVPLAVLELLSESAADAPLLILLDDAQSFDHASLTVLTFCARRLLAENVLMVFAVRTLEVAEWSDFESLETVHLSGLDALAGRKFVEAMGHSFTTKLFSATLGNPLALQQMATDSGSEGQLHLSDRLIVGFARGIRRLPSPTQRSLALLAVAGSIEPDVLHDALVRMGVQPGDLAIAATHGLLSSSGDFDHPLVREAARPTGAALLECHDALANAWQGRSPDRHLLHQLLGSSPHTAAMGGRLRTRRSRARSVAPIGGDRRLLLNSLRAQRGTVSASLGGHHRPRSALPAAAYHGVA